MMPWRISTSKSSFEQNFKKNLLEKDEEISHPRNHSQNLLSQIKKLKNEMKTQQKKLEQLVNEESLIDKETIMDPVELEKFLEVKVQTIDKEIVTDVIKWRFMYSW